MLKTFWKWYNSWFTTRNSLSIYEIDLHLKLLYRTNNIINVVNEMLFPFGWKIHQLFLYNDIPRPSLKLYGEYTKNDMRIEQVKLEWNINLQVDLTKNEKFRELD